MSGLVLVSFFSIIIALILIVAAFACLLGLVGGILLITGIIKKKRGRATKLKKVSVVFLLSLLYSGSFQQHLFFVCVCILFRYGRLMWIPA